MKKNKFAENMDRMEKEVNEILIDFVNHDAGGGDFRFVHHAIKNTMATFLSRCIARLESAPESLTVECLLDIQIDALQEGADCLREIRAKNFAKLDKVGMIH